jgi:hypothetical protein
MAKLSDPQVYGISFAVGFSFAAGLIVGEYITKRNLEAKHAEDVRREVELTKRHLEAIRKNQEKKTVEVVLDEVENQLDEMDEILEELKYSTDDADEDVVEEDPEYDDGTITSRDYVEMDLRFEPSDDGTPYIISESQWGTGDKENPHYDRQTVIWYEGDEVLTDEDDKIIPEIDKIVGLNNLNHFGLGSGDENVVFIRNDEMRVDFEVSRDKTKYTETVLGFIQHEEKRQKSTRKFRLHED